jgi:hypothetical protein
VRTGQLGPCACWLDWCFDSARAGFLVPVRGQYSLPATAVFAVGRHRSMRGIPSPTDEAFCEAGKVCQDAISRIGAIMLWGVVGSLVGDK